MLASVASHAFTLTVTPLIHGGVPLPFDVGQVMIVLVDQKAKKGDVKVAK